MTRFLVAGDALLDVHATPAEPIRPGADVPAVVRLGVGGQGANLAVRLARRGMAVRLACAVGADDLAPIVRSRLDAAGVGVEVVPSPATGAVVILLDPTGERTMLSHRVPFAPALGDRLPALAEQADWVVVSGYLLEEPGPVLVAAGTGSARRAVIGSPFRDPTGWYAALEAFDPHLVVLNRDEATALHDAGTAAPTGTTAATAVALAARLGGAVVVVTEASGAVAAATAVAPVTVSRPSDPSVVDTTGAGDAFAATLLAAIAATFPPGPDALRAAMERASSVASAVSRVVGAQVPAGAGDSTA